MPRPKAEKLIPACPICGGEMQVEYTCNMETFAGRAGWHMDFSPRLKMCQTCSNELLAQVNKWFKKQDKTGFYRRKWVKT